MLSFSRTTLCGELLEDPVITTTTNGKQVAKLRIATTEEYNGRESKDYHTVVAWERLAQQANFMRKGVTVYVEGKNKTRSYENKDGVKQYVTEVNATILKATAGVAGTLLSSITPPARDVAPPSPPPAAYKDNGNYDDIPF